MLKRFSEIFPGQIMSVDIRIIARRLQNRSYKSQMIREFIARCRNNKGFKCEQVGRLWLIELPKKVLTDVIYPGTFMYTKKIIEMSDDDFKEALHLIGIKSMIPISKYKRRIKWNKLLINENLDARLKMVNLWDGIQFDYDRFGKILKKHKFKPKKYVVTPQLIIRICQIYFDKIDGQKPNLSV